MSENRILFHDAALQQFDWCKINADGSSSNQSGSTDIQQLNTIFPSGTTVTVLVPQQQVFLTSADMPPRVSKQQLNAIAYAVEDNLAQDIEDCFFATYKQLDDLTVPVAIINQQLMEDIIALLSSYHLNARFILIPFYLCPWPETEQTNVIASICAFKEGYLIRTAQHQGLYCDEEVLKQVLQLIIRASTEEHKRIISYASLPADLAIDDVEIKAKQALNLIEQDIDEAGCINLKQKQFQSSHQWFTVLRQWKWPAASMILLVSILLVAGVIDLWVKQKTLDDLIEQQKNLLAQHLPNEDIGNQPKNQLVRYLSDNRSTQKNNGFLDQLHEYVRLKQGLSAVKTGKVQFQKSSLVVNIESSELKSLEDLRAKLNESSVPAQIENVNISPEKTTGRLVMQVQQ